MTRTVKQITFGGVFVVVVAFVVFGIYRWTRPTLTCFDKIQNQGEEGVDCGKVCGNTCLESLLPIKVLDSRLFKIRDINNQMDYDAFFRVSNPNIQFGSGNVEYELKILDGQGNILVAKNNSFYILPGQTKYVYEPLLKTNSSAGSVELKITKVDWQKLQGVFGQQVKLIVRSKDYFLNNKPGVFSRVTGDVFNSSDFDLDRVDVVVVIFKNNVPIGVNRTDLRTLTAQSDRFFEVDWVSPISEMPDRIDVEPTTNVFQDSNFIRRYGVPEKFQQP